MDFVREKLLRLGYLKQDTLNINAKESRTFWPRQTADEILQCSKNIIGASDDNRTWINYKTVCLWMWNNTQREIM